MAYYPDTTADWITFVGIHNLAGFLTLFATYLLVDEGQRRDEVGLPKKTY